jgi:hypothetical protein
MAIPSRQIGWGTEENLLWQISKQLETLTKVVYNIGGNTNTTTTTTTVSPTTTSTTTTVAPSTTTTTTTIAPGTYTFVVNTDGNPPLSGQFKTSIGSTFAYLSKTDLSGGTVATPQVGDLITYTNGSGGGWVNVELNYVNDEGTWWYLFSETATFQSGMTDGANYPTIITPVYTIGESALGGVIAYILQPGDPGYDAGVQKGLVATVADISTAAEWGCLGTLITGADGTAIGTGAANTADIVAECGTPGIAARLCGDLIEGGYSDWYLPSQGELSALYTNRAAIGGFSGFSSYLSSTEVDADNAYAIFFFGGNPITIGKNNGIRVRAIRSF